MSLSVVRPTLLVSQYPLKDDVEEPTRSRDAEYSRDVNDCQVLLLASISADIQGIWAGTRDYRGPINLDFENILAECAEVGVGVCWARTNPHGTICLQRIS